MRYTSSVVASHSSTFPELRWDELQGTWTSTVELQGAPNPDKTKVTIRVVPVLDRGVRCTQIATDPNRDQHFSCPSIVILDWY